MVGDDKNARSADERIGQVIGGRWILDRVLGQGGMATVFAAHDTAGVRAAVKVLHGDLAMSADTRARFLREYEITSQLDHPGMVRVLDQRANAPRDPYIAMELLEGQTLAQLAARSGRVEATELLGYIDQVLDVLARAHDGGVVHRDLKPANLFVTESGSVKLLDFGVARLIDPSAGALQTRTGLALGTAAYMAPEQALGKRDEIDARTDVFAIGAILFRLLSGRRIHDVRTDGELLAAMATTPAPAFATVVPGAPAGLAAVIDVALGFHRDSRYPNARTMQADVRAVLAGKPPPFATHAIASSEQATIAPGGAHAPAAPADDLVGTVVAGRYKVDKLLGAGGMGAVYRAEHVHMRKAVALKVLHREMTYVSEVVARFEREAVAASRIEHPNVAGATDFGKLEDGAFYLVLEYVEGQSLGELLQREKGLAPDRAVRIARQIAAALGAAHAAGIVHRDLKPDNVMLVQRGDNADFVKVLDFGIAKVSADDMRGQPVLTQLGSVFGTPEYMSPEQAMGQAVDLRTDLYALGIMLHEMLSGQGVPFAGDDLMATLTAQMTQPPPPLPASVPPALAALTARLLAKNPSDRFASAEELIAHLDALNLPALPPPSIQLRGAPPSVALGYGDTIFGGAPPASSYGAPSSGAPSTGGVVREAPASYGGPVSIGAPPNPVGVLARVEASELEAPRLVAAPFWQRSVDLAGQEVPIWMLVAISGGALLFGVAVVALVSAFAAPEPATTTGEARATESSPVSPSAAPAAEGSAPAPPPRPHKSTPGGEHWLALAHGFTTSGKYAEALNALSEALTSDPALAEDPRLLGDLRVMAEQPESAEQAQDLAATLGTSGADLLYDVALDVANSKPDLSRRARARVEACKHKSAALEIAIDLANGSTCGSYRELMPRAVAHADGRSLKTLEALAKPGPCGAASGSVRIGRLSLGKKKGPDCFACLREDDALERALERARQQPAPTFDAAE